MQWILLGMAVSSAVAQQATVSVSSGSAAPGGTVSLGVSLAAAGGAQPASLQWTMNYSASDVTSVNVTAGTNAIAANKSLSCSSTPGSTICVVWGLNANVINNGTLATATFQLASSILNTAEKVQVTNVVASTADGMGIPASGAGFTISVSQSTTLWSISGTISPSPAGSGASVTLSGAAGSTVTADASGNYIFSGLANGSYTVTPSKSAYAFSPSNQSVTLNGSNVVLNFTAQSCKGNGQKCHGAANAVTCSPGGLASLFGDHFTTQDPQRSTSFPLPTQLAGVRVMVNGDPAPLLFVSGSQINFQCPLLPPGSSLEVTVKAENGFLTPLGQSAMQAVAPSLFTSGAASQGVVLIGTTNEIAMPKTDGISSRPARKGEFVTIYANGLGEVADGVPTGTPAPLDRLAPLKNNVSVIVGSIAIEPAFAGLAPGTVGLFQINAQLPQGIPIGPAIPLYIRVTLADGTAFVSNTVSMAIDDLPSQ